MSISYWGRSLWIGRSLFIPSVCTCLAENITAGRGWIAVALVIFAVWNPYRALLALICSGLDIIGFRIQGTSIQVSQYLIDMLPYLVTIIVLVFVSFKKSQEHSPPKGLGKPYFRENDKRKPSARLTLLVVFFLY